MARAASLGSFPEPLASIRDAQMLAAGEARWGSIGYYRVALSGSRAFNPGPFLAAAMADARHVSAEAPSDVVPALGDDHMMPGLAWGEIRDRNRVVVGIDVACPVLTAFRRVRVRAGTVSDAISDLGSNEWLTGAQLAILWRNPVASIEWGFGLNSHLNRRFDLSVGRQF